MNMNQNDVQSVQSMLLQNYKNKLAILNTASFYVSMFHKITIVDF